jgi:hypothetical protein
MAKRIYRVVSACGALGYGFPRRSLQHAIQDGVDAIVADAGSMDAGPYYLGTGKPYFDREAVKIDFRNLVEATLATGSPVILGSCGMGGGDRNLEWMLQVGSEVFAELDVRDVKVAVIKAQIDPEAVIREYRAGALLATGAQPQLSEEALRESTIVGQMGVHPLMTALESGAQYIFAGRSCDAALFAADMIRHGIDAGLAYHVGHVLECGAIACDPGSPSDCLVAEIYDDGSAVFTAPDPERRCTPHSLAVHSLYEESHPQLQHYPEGILVMDQTEFFSRGGRSSGIRNSRFVRSKKPWPLSIKLEGSRWMGQQKVSLLHIAAEDLALMPPEALVYGRNGVERTPIAGSERELGLIIETTATTQDAATTLASLLAHHLSHHGYAGRKAAGSNLAYPLSPNLVSFKRDDGKYGAIVPGGTRQQAFIVNYSRIKSEVIRLVGDNFPRAMAMAQYRVIESDVSHPAVLLRTIDRNPQRLRERHQAELDAITRRASPQGVSLLSLDAGDVYEWSLYHLLQNEQLIRDSLFPITYHRVSGPAWVKLGCERPHYFDIGVENCGFDVDDRSWSSIAEAPPQVEAQGVRRLLDMAVVIRSKGAGVNRVTFDVVFNSAADYETALRSNIFFKENIAGVLGVSADSVIGSYFVDDCNAIKITVEWPSMSGSPDERDVFRAQQQARLERLSIPLFEQSMVKASAF